MKRFALGLTMAAGLMALPALAQTTAPARTTAPAQDEAAAAARLPNTFDGPASSAAPATTAPQPTQATSSPAPDIARAETALREVIAQMKTGEVDYTAFSTDLAEKVREQAGPIGDLLNQFGDIKAVRHIAQPDGVDMFEIDFENQKTEWVIGFDNEDQIAALLFRPAED